MYAASGHDLATEDDKDLVSERADVRNVSIRG